jgi:hypothetical protein
VHKLQRRAKIHWVFAVGAMPQINKIVFSNGISAFQATAALYMLPWLILSSYSLLLALARGIASTSQTMMMRMGQEKPRASWAGSTFRLAWIFAANGDTVVTLYFSAANRSPCALNSTDAASECHCYVDNEVRFLTHVL